MEPVGTVTTILLILVVMALMARWKKEWRSQNYPLGPLVLPVIGNLLQLRAANTCKTFRKLSEKYGPIFTLRFGSEWAVVVGYEVVWEVLVNRRDEFTDRGQFPLAEKTNKDLGIFMSNGETWAQTQPFTLTMLRDFGVGKRSVEEQVQEEMGLLLQELAQTKGQLFDPAMLLSAAMGNTICHILVSEHFSYGDEEYCHVLWHLAENFRLESSIAGQVRGFGGGGAPLALALPTPCQLTGTVPPCWHCVASLAPCHLALSWQLCTILPSPMNRLPSPHQTFFQNNSFEDFLARKVAEHEATLDSEASQDFVDAFLCRMEQVGRGDPGDRTLGFHGHARILRTLSSAGWSGGGGATPSSFLSPPPKKKIQKGNPRMAFRWDNMHAMAFNMFVSGTESTSITLCYCLMLLLEHPEVAGGGHSHGCWGGATHTPPTSPPSNAFIREGGAMPYTEAVLHEMLWFLNLTFIRRAKRDTQPGGFIIPKLRPPRKPRLGAGGGGSPTASPSQGCTIYPVLSSALRDPCHFKNPEAFDPCHFLDEKGVKKSEAFLPFSAGKCMCLGESLAWAQLFFFLTAILQRFQLRHPPRPPPPPTCIPKSAAS
ncbi:LOW QUALITY PROTEIN: cytochrome P450 2C16-like [Morphnus guianensis]